jgi:hypothetical protein
LEVPVSAGRIIEITSTVPDVPAPEPPALASWLA